MSVLVAILSFVVAIGVLVTVHEFGHFWVARRAGVKVLRFSIGFGRALWRRVGADGTEYVVAAIPLGGYVKMLDEREGSVASHEVDRAFNRKSLAARSAIVAAGPVFNFLFAVLAYWAVYTIGVSGLRAEISAVEDGSLAATSGLRAGQHIIAVDGIESRTWVAVIQRVLGGVLKSSEVPLQVQTNGNVERALTLKLDGLLLDDLTTGGFFSSIGITPARPQHPPIISSLTAGGAAERDGLQPGDRVERVSKTAVTSWIQWVRLIQASPGQALQVVVTRSDTTRTISVTPDRKMSNGVAFGFIGASRARNDELLRSYFTTERYGPIEALGKATHKTWEVSALTLRMFWKMLQLEISVKNLSGPISIAQYAGNSARSGPARFLEFLAIVSISLGILNLLPVPILDGGHLVNFAVEAVKGSPPSEQSQYIAQQVGLMLLVGLMGLAFYNDITRLLG